MKVTSYSILTALTLTIGVSSVVQAAPKSPAKKAAKSKTKIATVKPVIEKADDGILIMSGGSLSLPATSKPTVAKTNGASYRNDDIGNRMVQFCRSYLGRKMGNGQCTELALFGMRAAGARVVPSYRWGNLVCKVTPSQGRPVVTLGPAGKNANSSRPDIRPGDILQFERVKFVRQTEDSTYIEDYDHHTSIIESVSPDGMTFNVLEQNVGDTQIVLRGNVILSNMASGIICVYRAIPR